MTPEKTPKIDLNSASLEELQTLPGIGLAIAERILAARPFSKPEDIQRVDGVGPAVFARLKPLLVVKKSSIAGDTSETAEIQTSDEHPEEVREDANVGNLEIEQIQELSGQETHQERQAASQESEKESGPALNEAAMITLLTEAMPEAATPETIEEAPKEHRPKFKPVSQQPQPLSRSGAFWLALWTGLITLVLTISCTLGTLVLLNGGLSYARLARVNDLASQVNNLDSQTNSLQEEVTNLRDRLTSLEGLSGRMSTLEKDTSQLQEDVQSANQQVEEINQQMDQLSTQMKDMQSQTNRFQTFLDGLKELLNGLGQP